MKKGKNSVLSIKSFAAGILIMAGLFGISAPLYSAGPPTVISYQGRLANSSGDLLGSSSGTTYHFKFSLWTAVSGGTKLWPTADPTSFATTVRQGVFNVNIGDTANGYPDTLDYDFSATDVFLKVEVSSNGTSFETLSPRQQISSAAFARIAASVLSASSTITNLTSANATTTNATSTNIHVSGTASTTNLFANVLNAGASLFTSLLVNGSSTLQNFGFQNATGSAATTTNLYVSGRASTTDLRSNTATIGNLISSVLSSGTLTLSSLTGSGTRCLQTDNNGLISFAAGACGTGGGGSAGGTWSTTTSQVAGQLINYPNNDTDIVTVGNFSTTTAEVYFDPNASLAKIFNQYFGTSSSTFQSFTATNATTSQATTTNLAISSVVSKILKTGTDGSITGATAGTDYLASMTFAWPFTKQGNGDQATTTLIGLYGGFFSNASSTVNSSLLVAGSTTLQNFTATSATTTQATSTNFAVTSITSALVKASPDGSLVSAVAGTDYLASMSFAYPFLKLGTGENATSTTLAFLNGFLSTASSPDSFPFLSSQLRWFPPRLALSRPLSLGLRLTPLPAGRSEAMRWGKEQRPAAPILIVT